MDPLTCVVTPQAASVLRVLQRVRTPLPYMRNLFHFTRNTPPWSHHLRSFLTDLLQQPAASTFLHIPSRKIPITSRRAFHTPPPRLFVSLAQHWYSHPSFVSRFSSCCTPRVPFAQFSQTKLCTHPGKNLPRLPVLLLSRSCFSFACSPSFHAPCSTRCPQSEAFMFYFFSMLPPPAASFASSLACNPPLPFGFCCGKRSPDFRVLPVLLGRSFPDPTCQPIYSPSLPHPHPKAIK